MSPSIPLGCTSRQSGGLPLHDGGIIRPRPRPKLLQRGLLGLRSRAQTLVEIVAILERAHQTSFPFV